MANAKTPAPKQRPSAVARPRARLVLLDTHAILHRAYHALPDFSSSKGVPTGGLYGLLTMLVKIINELRPDYIAAAVDLPGGTFRDAAYKDYKGTRAETEDALVEQLKRAPRVLEAFGVPVYSAKGFEADDVIGTMVEKLKKNKNVEVVIASGDKDTLQLINEEHVRVFTLGKGLTDTIMYDEAKVRERYGFGPESVPDLKGIAGDPSDNIKGVPGVGEGSALKLLQTYGSLDGIYAALKKYGVEAVAAQSGVQKRFAQLVSTHKEEAEFSKLLATIRRDAPIDFALPKQSWREGANPTAALDMLNEFEFRALIPRVKTVLGIAPQSSSAPGEIHTTPPPSAEDSASPLQGSFAGALEVPKEKFDAGALMVSVLDSNIAEPELEDIFRLGKSTSIDEALANLRTQLKDNDLEFVYERVEAPLAPVLRRMEARGIKVDRAFLEKLSKDYTRELEALAKRIYKHAGFEFNIASPKQLGDVLFDTLGLGLKNQKKTAGGARSTRESELVKLREQHEIIDDILAYRELSKLLGTYIDALPSLLDTNDRVHTRFVTIGAATGRIASKDPNLQNIPIKTDLGRAIRHAFVADEGYTLVSFDYSQIELRIAAFLSGDEALAEVFRQGRDVHASVAARVFHVKEEDVTPEMRRRAKVINFGILYGMGVTSLQQALGTKRGEAQEFYDQYFAAFPRLAAYIKEVQHDAARLGYTRTYFGRRRYLDGIRSPIPYVRAAAERMAINAPIQGTQADIVKLAMIGIDTFLEQDGLARGTAKGRCGHLLLQVHDELVFEIEDKGVEACLNKIREIMEGVVPEKDRRGIPFSAEGKLGKNWGEMKKI